MNRVFLNITLDEELKKELKRIAIDEDITVSKLIIKACNCYIENEYKKNNKN